MGCLQTYKDNRQFELDIMRAVAILLIIAAHLNGYTSVLKTPAYQFFAELGLSMFIFISGYSLALKYKNIETWKDVKNFLFRRILRIYPLYIPALLLFIVLFHHYGIWHQWEVIPIFSTKVLVHIAGGQIVLSPMITPVATLWFVGCIMLYYLVYVALARYGDKVWKIVITAVVIFLLLAVLKIFVGIIDYRFFYYYPIFVGGVLACHLRLFKVKSRQNIVIVTALILFVIMMGIAFSLSPLGRGLHRYKRYPIDSFIAAEGALFIFSIMGVLFLAYLARIAAVHFYKRFRAFIMFMSISSYAVYLFHRPILATLTAFLQSVLGLSGSSSDIVLIVFGLPLAIFLCYYIQRFSDIAIHSL
jgi:peptidoglycan/LPS O-acetylase OafA/YrhL